jgi:hypothetical protein
MKSRLTVLCVFVLSAGICQPGMSQVLAPAPPPLDSPGTTFILPSPLLEQTLASPNATFILPAPLPTLPTLPTLQLQQLQWHVANEKRNSDSQIMKWQQSSAATAPNAIRELRATAAARQTVLNNTMAAQMQARAAFENDLWRIGPNGAKVASVRSESTRDRTGTGDYVVVEAVASSLSNNLGYTRTRVRKNGDMGATTVPSD